MPSLDLIHIKRDERDLGSFTMEQAIEGLAARTLRLDDLAFCEGLLDWIPLGALLNVSDLPTTAEPRIAGSASGSLQKAEAATKAVASGFPGSSWAAFEFSVWAKAGAGCLIIVLAIIVYHIASRPAQIPPAAAPFPLSSPQKLKPHVSVVVQPYILTPLSSDLQLLGRDVVAFKVLNRTNVFVSKCVVQLFFFDISGGYLGSEKTTFQNLQPFVERHEELRFCQIELARAHSCYGIAEKTEIEPAPGYREAASADLVFSRLSDGIKINVRALEIHVPE